MVSPEHKYLSIELLQKETLVQGAAFMHSILFDQSLTFKSPPMLESMCPKLFLCIFAIMNSNSFIYRNIYNIFEMYSHYIISNFVASNKLSSDNPCVNLTLK